MKINLKLTLKIFFFFILPISLFIFFNKAFFDKNLQERYLTYPRLKKINNKIPLSENVLKHNIYTQIIPGTFITKKKVNLDSSFCIEIMFATYKNVIDKKFIDLELYLPKNTNFKEKILGYHFGKIEDNKFRRFCYPDIKLKLLTNGFKIKLNSKKVSNEYSLAVYFKSKYNKNNINLGNGDTFLNDKLLKDYNLLLRFIYFKKYDAKKKYLNLFNSIIFILIYLISIFIFFNDKKK